MRVLHLSTFDIGNGAAKAAFRVHKGLRARGIDSYMLVQNKLSDDPFVIGPKRGMRKYFALCRPYFDDILKALEGTRADYNTSLSWLPSRIANMISDLDPDIIHLHWINGGFISVETIATFKHPMVWTFHDLWPFSGSNHYPKIDYGTYKIEEKSSFLNQWVLKRKKKKWRDTNIVGIAPSEWIKNESQRSEIWSNREVLRIANCIDTEKYKPIDKSIARDILNLDENYQYLLFGAISPTKDPRKGFHILLEVLQNFLKSRQRVKLIIFGASKGPKPLLDQEKEIYAGRLHDETSLALYYAAADLFLAPSIQDNLPNTILESMACGTPSIAFDVGGISDMIRHRENGYLAKPFEVKDFVAGIEWALNNNKDGRISHTARKYIVENFSNTVQIPKLNTLYNSVLENKLSPSSY